MHISFGAVALQASVVLAIASDEEHVTRDVNYKPLHLDENAYSYPNGIYATKFDKEFRPMGLGNLAASNYTNIETQLGSEGATPRYLDETYFQAALREANDEVDANNEGNEKRNKKKKKKRPSAGLPIETYWCPKRTINMKDYIIARDLFKVACDSDEGVPLKGVLYSKHNTVSVAACNYAQKNSCNSQEVQMFEKFIDDHCGVGYAGGVWMKDWRKGYTRDDTKVTAVCYEVRYDKPNIHHPK
jgi:hypothetical protein